MASKAYEIASSSEWQLLPFLCYHIYESDLLLTAIVLAHLLLAWLLFLSFRKIEDEFLLVPNEIDPADDDFENFSIGAHLFMFIGLAGAVLSVIRTYYSWEVTMDVGLVLTVVALGLFLGFFVGRDPDNGGLRPLVIALEDACLALWQWILWPLTSLWDRIGTSARETAALRVQLVEANTTIQGHVGRADETAALRVELAEEIAIYQQVLSIIAKETAALEVQLEDANKKTKKLQDVVANRYRGDDDSDGSDHDPPGSPSGPSGGRPGGTEWAGTDFDSDTSSESDNESGNGDPPGPSDPFPSATGSNTNGGAGHCGTSGPDVPDVPDAGSGTNVESPKDKKEKEKKEREEKKLKEEKEEKEKNDEQRRKEEQRKIDEQRKMDEQKKKVEKERKELRGREKHEEKEKKDEQNKKEMKQKEEREKKERERKERERKESEEEEKKTQAQKDAGVTWSHFNNGETNRAVLIQSAPSRHAVVNPMEDIPGRGRLMFLSEADRIAANRRGHTTPHAVSMAHRRGRLAAGTATNSAPIVVFMPDPETLNPIEPHGPGAWRFLTSAGETSDRGRAASQFGGTRGLPVGPSARHINQLRQLFERNLRPDLTAQIDIVWVPGDEDVEDDIHPVLDVCDYEEEEVPEVRPAVPEVRPAVPEVRPAIPQVRPAIPQVSSAGPESAPLKGVDDMRAAKDDASKTVKQQPIVKPEPETNLPTDADPAAKKGSSKTVGKQPAVQLEPGTHLPTAAESATKKDVGETVKPQSTPESPQTVNTKLPTDLGPGSQRKNDSATEPKKDGKSSATTGKDPSSMDYYSRGRHNRALKLEVLKKNSTWIPHDTPQGEQSAQPTGGRQPGPAAEVD
jgi:hypothetical protein